MAYKTFRRLTMESAYDTTNYDFEDQGMQPTGGGEDEPEFVRTWTCESMGLEVHELGPFEYGWVVGNGDAYGTADSFESAAKCAIVNHEWRG